MPRVTVELYVSGLVHVHDAPAEPANVRARAAARVRFGLAIEGGAFCTRDGYDPMEWSVEGESLRTVPMPDGDYAFDAPDEACFDGRSSIDRDADHRARRRRRRVAVK